MPTSTCTHCDAETADDSDLCEIHHAERARVGEHPTACICWGCARYFGRNTGLKARYIATAKAHPSTVMFLRASAEQAFHRAMMSALADESTAATIASIEAQSCEAAA